MNIGTHPEFILKPVLNVKNQFITHCIQIETHTLNHYTNTTRISVFQMTLTYHSSLFSPSISHTLRLSFLHHHSHRSPSYIC